MPGKDAGEAVDAVDYRSIDVEVLRDFFTDLVDRSSLTLVAGRVGLPRTSLNTFLAGANPYRRTHRKLAFYYLAAAEIAPREQALAALTDSDGDLTHVLLRAITDYHQARGRPVPSWVEVLQRDR